jgi:hypothetical protein
MRETLSLSISYQETKPISIVPGTTAFPQRGIAGGIGWSHEFSPEMIGNAFLQYGHTQSGNLVGSTSPSVGTGETVTVGSTLTYQFSPTLVGYLRYMFTYRDAGGIGASSATQNVLIAGVRQTF